MKSDIVTVGLRNALLLLSLLSCGMSTLAWAQSTALEDDIPRYRVEVVLFSQPDLGIGEEELPRLNDTEISRPMAWPLRETDRQGLGYERLDPTTHRLQRIADRIAAQPNFDVHWHAAWVQPGEDRLRAQAVAIPRTLREEGLSGWIRVYRQRFLHTETGIRLWQDDEPIDSMTVSRRMRSDETHYLDHPHLGLVVRVERWESPESP